MTNILCLSDLHFGKDDETAIQAIDRAIEIAKRKEIDILYFGGDLAEPGKIDELEHFKRGIEKLNQIKAKKYAWCTGNNDWELLKGHVVDYAEEMAELLSQHSYFKCLDNVNFVKHEDVALVGGIGWYNGTLWVEHPNTPDLNEAAGSKKGDGDWPKKWDEVKTRAEQYWQIFMDRHNNDCTSDFIYEDSMNAITDKLYLLNRYDHIKKVVVATHFVPNHGFCKYGHSLKFDYLNYFMGYDDKNEYNIFNQPKVVKGLTGHTHRHKTVTIGNTDVVNVSGSEQPYLLQI